VTLVPTPPTRIQLCGPTVIERDGERLDGRLPGRQGRLLFAYLVLNRHQLTSRDKLAEAIWPRQLPSAAQTGLNALISKLRRILGPEVIDGRTSLAPAAGTGRGVVPALVAPLTGARRGQPGTTAMTVSGQRSESALLAPHQVEDPGLRRAGECGRRRRR
jgi:hypothetical protein